MAYTPTPDTALELWLTFFLIAATTGIAFDGLFRLIWKIHDLGRHWVITVPYVVGGKAHIERRRTKNGEVTDKDGDEGQTRILSGDAAYPSNRGPLHILAPDGSNLVAPTKDEPGPDAKTGKDIKSNPDIFRRFRIWDPLVYWRATRENDMQDLYSAQKEKEHWAVKLAGPAMFLLVGLMGFLGFILWKIYPLLERAG